MATKFLDPGGDATFSLATTNGFWQVVSGAMTIVSDFVHGTHQRSIRGAPGGVNYLTTPDGVITDAGSRVSAYFYLKVLPAATSTIMGLSQAGDGSAVVAIRVTSAGVLQLWNTATGNQIGSNGATLSAGTWYRISIAYTITSTTVNRFEMFLNGVSTISVTNATLTRTTTSDIYVGNDQSDASLDIRISDIYSDNSSSLTDPGNIWVTAKRPNANGTTNGFTTQIGSGGSGYGTGHSPQVNERPLSTTNGWSVINSGSTVTEEYTIEGKSVGDIDISSATIVDYMGWVSASSVTSETASIIVAGSTSNISLTSSAALFKKIAGSTTYPAGGTDIGIMTSPTVTTVGLYECGIIVAYIPAATINSKFLAFF